MTASAIKVVFCWSHVSGYMAACWRALAARPGIELHILALASEQAHPQHDIEQHLMRDLPHTWLTPAQAQEPGLIRDRVTAQRPRVVVFSGWSMRGYRALATDAALDGCARVMAMDTPWRGTWRQRLGRWWLRSLVQRLDRVLVPGRRAAELAMRLGVSEDRIAAGLYACDGQVFHPPAADAPPRRGWLFVGRYVDVKGIDTLAAAYERYRSRVEAPWPLDVIGAGPLARVWRGREGVTDHGYQPQHAIADRMRQAGAFVLASHYEPWGVVLAEAMACGLPVVCTTACGAADELLHDDAAGRTVAPDDPLALAQAMQSMQQCLAASDAPCRAALKNAADFVHTAWADRMQALLHELT
jgi:glycosyltransferase involved in cell wall biosynthesis